MILVDVKRPLILNVDDNDAGRYVVTRILKDAGFQVIEASNGQEALRLAAQNPALILLDVNLPDVDGFEVRRILKSNPSTAVIPIVHLSATYVDSDARVSGLEEGADGYLIQPVEPRELLATIESLLRLKDILKQTGEYWQTTFDTLNHGICLLGTDHSIIRCNQAMAELVGSTPEELIGRHCYEIVHGTAHPIPECPLERALQSLVREQLEVQCKDCWYEMSVDPLLSDKGKLQSAVHIMYDLTTHKRVEQSLRKTEERFRLGTAATHVVVYELDVRTNWFNAMYGLPELLGYSESGYAVDWWIKRLNTEDIKEYESTLKRTITTQTEQVVRYRIYRSDGTELFVEDHAKPVYDESGQIVRLIGTIIDITEKEATRRDLEKMLASRAEFLATCSHELKTPLTVMRANTDLFRDKYSSLDEQQRVKFLTSMTNQIKKLDRLVTDLLDVSRLETGHLTVNLEATPLHELVKRIVDDFTRSCYTHNIVARDFPRCICSIDSVRFEQMLNNLLTNAAKYSEPETTIMIDIACIDGYAEVSVTDQGFGIPQADINKLYQRYYRHPTTGTASGLGVGLYVTMELARLHKGTVSAESSVGKGSTFTIKLPLL